MTSRRTMLLAVVICAASAAVAAAPGPPSIVVLSPLVDLGSVRPSVDGIAAPEPRSAPIPLLIQSSSPWSLTATLESNSAATQLLPDGDRIEIRPAGRVWTRLQLSLPIPLASGGETGPAGDSIPLEVRVISTLDSPPGSRHVRIRFAIASDSNTGFADVSYAVPVVTQLNDDLTPFVSPRVNPARPGLYPYEIRTYQVVSNVPWVVEATLSAPAIAQASAATLPQNTLVITNETGVAQPLVPNEPVAIASGGASGQQPRSVQLRLAVKVDDAVLPAGDYSGQLSLSIRPAASSGSGTEAAVRR